MHDAMMKMEEIRELKNTLLDTVKAEVAKGVQCVDTKEAGEVIDMIKDLAEAEKCCMEACYYTKIVEAMDETSEDVYGYNNRRYSNGRYAPKGRGRMMGYNPTMMQMPYMMDYLDDPEDFEYRMGYSGQGGNSGSRSGSMGGRGNRSQSGSRGGSYGYDGGDGRYGMPYRQYRDSRRYYTETHSPEAKQDMDAYASEHVGDTITSIREIWKDADPEMRRKLKNDFTKLVDEMKV